MSLNRVAKDTGGKNDFEPLTKMKMDVGCCVEPNIVEYKGTHRSKLIRIDKIVCVSGQHEINNVLNFFFPFFYI